MFTNLYFLLQPRLVRLVNVRKQKVIIIGAGIGGLATANLMAAAGYDVHIYEASDIAGGRAGILKKDGFTFDTGPSWYLMPEVFEHYFQLFGHKVSSLLDLKRLSPAYKVFFENNTPITITSNLTKDAATFDAIESGAGTWLKGYVANSDTVYKLSLEHFLYSNFQRPQDFIKSTLLRRGAKMAQLALTPIHTYIARSLRDKRLQQILEYPMVFLGTSPFKAPALYSLMSALDFKEGVYYPQGGLYKIIESLLKIGRDLGVKIHYSSAVKEILVQDGKARSVKVGSATIVADIVISNADLHFTETRLLQPAHQTYPASYWKKQQAGPSALLMYLGVKGSIPEFTHHNLLFVDDWRQNFHDIYSAKKLSEKPSIYICKPSETDSTVAPKDHENIFVLVPLPAGVSVNSRAAEKLADRYITHIETMTNVTLRERIVSRTIFSPNEFGTKFNSWQNTALGPSHILRQSAFFRTPNISKKVKNLYYVGGSTVPGIGLPMCLIGAELVYKRIVGDTKGGQVDAIATTLGHLS
jgi:phytoene desaturase